MTLSAGTQRFVNSLVDDTPRARVKRLAILLGYFVLIAIIGWYFL